MQLGQENWAFSAIRVPKGRPATRYTYLYMTQSSRNLPPENIVSPNLPELVEPWNCHLAAVRGEGAPAVSKKETSKGEMIQDRAQTFC